MSGPWELHQRIRAHTLELCKHLEPEDWCCQPAPEASPPKWHLAHTTWFYDTFIMKDLGLGIADATWTRLFNSYYQTVGTPYPRPRRGMLLRPTVAEVLDYRKRVDAHLERASATFDDRQWALLALGGQHEQQHQELLVTDLKWAWSSGGIEPSLPVPAGISTIKPQENTWMIPCDQECIVEIGHQGETFAYDNEGPVHRQLIRPFAIASNLVSNGDWLAFMADKGYERHDLWQDTGWHCARNNGWKAPRYWRQVDGSWQRYSLYGWQDIDTNEPVSHISWYEADAYASWKGCRLPTEFEWEYALKTKGTDPLEKTHYLHPRPQKGEQGLNQAFGAVWQWTRSDYAPYPGFAPAEGAIGEYNGKFMSGLMVLRGSSCATPPGHERPTYRNFFAPADRWQFTGLRLAKDVL